MRDLLGSKGYTHMKPPRKRRRSFWDYKPLKHPLGKDYGYDGCLIETYGEDVELIVNQCRTDPTRVWTVLDSDEVVAGWHFVNRLGYIITELPWESGDTWYKKV